jgi:uncharacterized cupin superfamily protein
MPRILNLEDVPGEFIDDPDFTSKMKTLRLGSAAGSLRIYINIDFVKSGGKSVKYHSHSIQEEFFLILEGEATLRMNGEEIPVKKGDFVAKPAGKGIAHQFINTSDEVLQILDCGLVDSHDVITYPDEDVILLKEHRLAFKRASTLENWSADPNQ